jgi:putative FmdB family regulatory protein
MPTYVYECSKCSNVFEVDQRITEEPLKNCHCGSEGTVKRVIQPPAILFKGPGFYVTDSAKAQPASPSSGAETSSTKATEGASTEPAPPSSTDTKTASPAPEAKPKS